jgi:protein TonB
MERRLFTDLVESDAAAPTGNKGYTLPVSLAVHALVLVAVVVVPLLSSGALPEPTSAVKAFFVEPASAPPPPPPPPPLPSGGARSPARTAATPPPATTLIAPSEMPEHVAEGDGGIGDPVNGDPNGVPDGDPNGVVERTTIVGLPAPPPGPTPVVVGGSIQRPKKLKDAAPLYPTIARNAHVQGVVILECTIDPHGRVQEVRVLRGIPLLDQAATDAVRQWAYTPTLLNGVPVSVIMTVTVSFSLR